MIYDFHMRISMISPWPETRLQARETANLVIGFRLEQQIVIARRQFIGQAGYDEGMSCEQNSMLLSIIELGGYPNFRPLYESLGFEVAVETRMRKALGFLKHRKVDVIVAEFNFQSDFRDRTSSLESLLAVVQRMPGTRVIVFYEKEFTPQFENLRARLPVHRALEFPVDASALKGCLQAEQLESPVG